MADVAGPIIQSIPTFIAFGLGIVSGVVVKYFEDRFFRPVIRIGQDTFWEIVNLRPDLGLKVKEEDLYTINRIVVRNIGRTAAKDCKIYFQNKFSPFPSLQRLTWLTSDKNSVYTTITLNVQDEEYVDFCAVSKDGKTILFPPGNGFSASEGIGSCNSVPFSEYEGVEFTFMITSSNATLHRRDFKIVRPSEPLLGKSSVIVRSTDRRGKVLYWDTFRRPK